MNQVFLKEILRSFLVKRVTTAINERADGLGRLPLSARFNNGQRRKAHEVLSNGFRPCC